MTRTPRSSYDDPKSSAAETLERVTRDPLRVSSVAACLRDRNKAVRDVATAAVTSTGLRRFRVFARGVRTNTLKAQTNTSTGSLMKNKPCGGTGGSQTRFTTASRGRTTTDPTYIPGKRPIARHRRVRTPPTRNVRCSFRTMCYDNKCFSFRFFIRVKRLDFKSNDGVRVCAFGTR